MISPCSITSPRPLGPVNVLANAPGVNSATSFFDIDLE